MGMPWWTDAPTADIRKALRGARWRRARYGWRFWLDRTTRDGLRREVDLYESALRARSEGPEGEYPAWLVRLVGWERQFDLGWFGVWSIRAPIRFRDPK